MLVIVQQIREILEDLDLPEEDRPEDPAHQAADHDHQARAVPSCCENPHYRMQNLAWIVPSLGSIGQRRSGPGGRLLRFAHPRRTIRVQNGERERGKN